MKNLFSILLCVSLWAQAVPTGHAVHYPGHTSQADSLPSADIKANGSDGPIAIPYNTAATLKWQSKNVKTCHLNGAQVANSGSKSTGKLTAYKAFLLQCTGPRGSAFDALAVTMQPANRAPIGSLERAADEADGDGIILKGGSLIVEGWAADPEDGAPVSKVQIRLNDAVVGNATLAISRPDIAQQYNRPDYTNSGFKFKYDTKNLQAGDYSVQAIAIDSKGTYSPLGSKRITVGSTCMLYLQAHINSPSMYIEDLVSLVNGPCHVVVDGQLYDAALSVEFFEPTDPTQPVLGITRVDQGGGASTSGTQYCKANGTSVTVTVKNGKTMGILPGAKTIHIVPQGTQYTNVAQDARDRMNEILGNNSSGNPIADVASGNPYAGSVMPPGARIIYVGPIHPAIMQYWQQNNITPPGGTAACADSGIICWASINPDVMNSNDQIYQYNTGRHEAVGHMLGLGNREDDRGSLMFNGPKNSVPMGFSNQEKDIMKKNFSGELPQLSDCVPVKGAVTEDTGGGTGGDTGGGTGGDTGGGHEEPNCYSVTTQSGATVSRCDHSNGVSCDCYGGTYECTSSFTPSCPCGGCDWGGGGGQDDGTGHCYGIDCDTYWNGVDWDGDGCDDFQPSRCRH